MTSNPIVSSKLPRYKRFDPLVPVWCVTPETPRTIHRYFDSTPFSPSGRFIASTQLPQEDRLPSPGEIARVVLTDLTTGVERAVAETAGWDTQVGAHVHWGEDDGTLLFNDVDQSTWQPYGVRLDLDSGRRDRFDGPIYCVSSDRSFAMTPNLRRTGLVQAGYGVVAPMETGRDYDSIPDDDGVFRTDLSTGASRLVVSLRTIADTVGKAIRANVGEEGMLLGFHMSLSPTDDRLLFIVRWVRFPKGLRALAASAFKRATFPLRMVAAKCGLDRLRRFMKPAPMVLNTLITMAVDGSDVRVLLPAHVYSAGGHHPNWSPDGKSVVMNLMIDKVMRFVRLDARGEGPRVLSDSIVGSGHPTLHPNQRCILTDAYPFEPVSFGDGSVPIRWVDFERGAESTLVRMPALAKFRGPKLEMRVDPHPAWNASFSRFAFNGYADGVRRVYIADAQSLDRG